MVLWTPRDIGNGEMNSSVILAMAQWTPPRYWQLHNEHLHDGGSTKRMGNLSSAFEKVNTSTAYPYGAMNSSRVGNLLLNCQQLYMVARNLKGLSQDDGRIFLRISAHILKNEPNFSRIHLAGPPLKVGLRYI
jgi:hypothetical protein